MQDHQTGRHAPVLLPAAKLAAKPHPGREQQAAARWRESGLHEALRAAGAGLRRFQLHDGPPYANGDPHMGHAVNKLLKDTFVRALRMSGMDASLEPGWDCHGLPVEWMVEAELASRGTSRKDLGTLGFRRACRDWAAGWVGRQADGFRRLGVVADWDRAYVTMSPEADAATVSRLHDMARRGLLYRDLRPVLWSVPEATALADAEVAYREVRHPSLTVRFPVRRSRCPLLEGASLLCWTTTPWSLPGNKAVACSVDASYAVVRVDRRAEGSLLVKGELVVLSAVRAADVLAEAGAESWTRVHELPGSAIEGTVCSSPLLAQGFNGEVPVLCASFADAASGTGLVHVAPSLGPDDFKLARERGLDLAGAMEADGSLSKDLPAFGGMAVLRRDGSWGEAGKAVLDALLASSAAACLGHGRHQAAHSWRSGAPLVHRATPQWFVRVDDGLRERAVRALDGVEFMPPASRARLQAMLATRPDWCVSRQRAWGVPLGLFVRGSDGTPLLDEDVLGRVREAFSEDGSDAWFSRPASWFLGARRDPADWQRCDDVVDVWFESGALHSWVPHRHRNGDGVADLLVEGSDQHRGWFQSSLLSSVAAGGKAPYRALLTHGFVLDAKGRKMSKSLRNGACPLEAADRHGADVLRLWTLSSDYTEDLRWSEEAARSAAETLRRFRNALRFALGNLGSAAFERVDRASMELPELWMASRLAEVGNAMHDDLDARDPRAMVRRLAGFCSGDLGSWYDMRKDSLYCDREDSLRRRGVCTAMEEVFSSLVAWLGPLAPFAADEAWRERHGATAPDASLSRWPGRRAPDPVVTGRFAVALRLRSSFLSRAEPLQRAGTLGSPSEAVAVVRLSPADAASLEGVDLASVLGAAAAEATADAATSVDVRRSAGCRCVRCRRTLPEVPTGGLCRRCEEVAR